VIVGVAALLGPALVRAQTREYAASLSGASEVPPTTSTATGSFTATLDERAKTLRWTLSVPSIDSVTMSHIHQGARDANGPVVLPLFIPGSPADSINASGTASAEHLEGPLRGDWDGFVAALKAGDLYINVHTTGIPSGEIRGQVGVTAEAGSSTATTGPARAGTPTAPSTGQAGLLGDPGGWRIAAVALLLTAGTVAGGRLLGRRSP